VGLDGLVLQLLLHELHGDVAHLVRVLRDGRPDLGVVLDGRQQVGGRVDADDQRLEVAGLDGAQGAHGARLVDAVDRVEVRVGLEDGLRRSQRGLALHAVARVGHELEIRVLLEGLEEALLALARGGDGRHADQRDVALSAQLVGDVGGRVLADLDVVGLDEAGHLGADDVDVDGDHRDSRGQHGLDRVGEAGRVDGVDQQAVDVLLRQVLDLLDLGLNLVVGAHHLQGDAVLVRVLLGALLHGDEERVDALAEGEGDGELAVGWRRRAAGVVRRGAGTFGGAGGDGQREDAGGDQGGDLLECHFGHTPLH
jgi:hypothetical protein